MFLAFKSPVMKGSELGIYKRKYSHMTEIAKHFRSMSLGILPLSGTVMCSITTCLTTSLVTHDIRFIAPVNQ